MLNEYYKETDPIKREEILGTLSADACSPEQQRQLRALFDLRYASNGKGGYNDRFLGAWMELKIVIENRIGGLAKRRIARQVSSALQTLCLNRTEEFDRDILYREMCHLVSLYIYACSTDTNYGSLLWGMGKISEEKLQSKLTADLKQLKETIPQYAADTDNFDILKNAITDILKA